MSRSPHSVRLHSGLRAVRCLHGRERIYAEERRRELEESERRGFEAGQRSMSEQLVQQRAQVLEVYHGLLQSIQQALPALVRQAEAGLAALVGECTRKVLAGTAVSAELAAAVVREALAGLEASAVYAIHLHPEDATLLEQTLPEVLGMTHAGVNLERDPTVGRGGCVIKTASGVIDATPRAKIEKLERAVLC